MKLLINLIKILINYLKMQRKCQRNNKKTNTYLLRGSFGWKCESCMDHPWISMLLCKKTTLHMGLSRRAPLRALCT